MTDWTKVVFFQREEWVKNPDRVHADLVYATDEYRRALGRPVVILVAVDSAGHEPDSAHYPTASEPWGMAVDLYAPGVLLVEQWLAAERITAFCGVGLYPHWTKQTAPGIRERIPGLHLDIRPKPEHPLIGRRWWRNAAGMYLPLDRAFLRQLADDAFPVAPSNST